MMNWYVVYIFRQCSKDYSVRTYVCMSVGTSDMTIRSLSTYRSKEHLFGEAKPELKYYYAKLETIKRPSVAKSRNRSDRPEKWELEGQKKWGERLGLERCFACRKNTTIQWRLELKTKLFDCSLWILCIDGYWLVHAYRRERQYYLTRDGFIDILHM